MTFLRDDSPERKPGLHFFADDVLAELDRNVLTDGLSWFCVTTVGVVTWRDEPSQGLWVQVPPEIEVPDFFKEYAS